MSTAGTPTNPNESKPDPAVKVSHLKVTLVVILFASVAAYYGYRIGKMHGRIEERKAAQEAQAVREVQDWHHWHYVTDPVHGQDEI